MNSAYKIAVFYYTQTGQLRRILENLLQPLTEEGCVIVWKIIEPEPPFPFPWTKESFYQAFPESRLGIPCPVKPIDFSDIQDANLVIIGYQPWFLSPSIPVSSFLQSEQTAAYLKDKKVLTVAGTRNMWVTSHDVIEEYFKKAGAHRVGNIVLEDKHNNYISVLTIFRWLIGGIKEKTKYLPEAGVSETDVAGVARLAPEVLMSLKTNDFSSLQERIVAKGGTLFHSYLYQTEKVGRRMFGVFARWIVKKGAFNDPARWGRLKCFSLYLMFVIFVVSPIGTVFLYLLYPLRHKALSRARKNYIYLSN